MMMVNRSSIVIKSLGLMVFAIIFLVLGTVYMVIPINSKFVIPIFAILSLIPAPLSFYYGQIFTYWEYLCTIFSLPYIVLFWSIIKLIDQYKPLLKNKILTVMYCFIHIPFLIFVMDVLNYFNSNGNIGPVGYIAIVVISLTIVTAVLLSTVFFCLDFCSMKT